MVNIHAKVTVKGKDGASDMQVTLVSYWLGCGTLFLHSVYARVSSAMSFIRQHVPDI